MYVMKPENKRSQRLEVKKVKSLFFLMLPMLPSLGRAWEESEAVAECASSVSEGHRKVVEPSSEWCFQNSILGYF